MHKFILVIILLSVILSFGAGESCKYLWLGIGSRTLALGNSGTSLSDLPWAPFYNPASVSQRGKFSLAGGNQFLALGRKLYFASVASEIYDGAGIGLTWIHSSVSDVEARNTDGEKVGTVANGEDAIFFAFAKKPTNNIHLGIGVEYVQSSIENITTGTAGLGAGISYRIKSPDITIGLSAQNLFMNISWNSNDYYGMGNVSNEQISPVFRGGVSYRGSVGEYPFLICGDLWQFSSTALSYGMGVEFSPMAQLTLRAGFSDGYPSAGIGIHTKIGKMSLVGIDYAVVPEKEELSIKHIVDLIIEY